VTLDALARDDAGIRSLVTTLATNADAAQPAWYHRLPSRLAVTFAQEALRVPERRHEDHVRSLEWRDVNLRARTLTLRAVAAKNKKAKVIPLRGEVLAILERRAALRRLDCVFVFHRDGHPLGDYRKAWRTACKAPGLTGLVPHDLRRSAARNAIRSGTPEQVVMDLGGWRTRSVFGRYNVTSEKDLADALERVSAYVADRREETPTVVPLAAATGTSGENADTTRTLGAKTPG